MTPDSIIAEITAAFDGVFREDGKTLHEAEELDCHGTPEELQRARQLDTDTRWQDVPDEWIGRFSSAFRYMDAKGLRYYLPRVMIWHFKHSHWSEPASADNVASLLVGDFAHDCLSTFFSILTESQRRATARWLMFPLQDRLNELNEYEKQYIERLMGSPWSKYLVK